MLLILTLNNTFLWNNDCFVLSLNIGTGTVLVRIGTDFVPCRYLAIPNLVPAVFQDVLLHGPSRVRVFKTCRVF